MTDTATRMLRLLSLLQAGRRWPGPALAERLAVTTRTVRTDVDRLRALGYEIDVARGSGGGYRLRSGSALPPLLLDDREALAVAVALRTAATAGVAGIDDAALAAGTKLEQLLPSRLRHRLQTMTAVAETVPSRRDPVDPAVLTAVAAACRACEQLRFDYADHRGTPTGRHVEPHRLLHVAGRWYLVAYDLGRAGWRSFRVDRITPRIPTGPRFVPRALPEPELEEFVTRGRMTTLWAHRARVVVHAPAAAVAARIPVGSWSVRPRDEHSSVLDAGAHTAELLAVYLGALGLDFEVDPDEHPELHAAVAALASRYRSACSPGGTARA